MCRRMGEAFNNFTTRIFATVLGDEIMLIKKICAVLYEKQAVSFIDLFLKSMLFFYILIYILPLEREE